jgi:hypothetical protein
MLEAVNYDSVDSLNNSIDWNDISSILGRIRHLQHPLKLKNLTTDNNSYKPCNWESWIFNI